ncbi:hypothetical protein F4604DRAFT_1751851 [Suillus subluteus]|nr:hypothetical protein F4604DRAFT_1751851 [Suillus subluteus]
MRNTTQMTAEALAIVFSPNLLRAPQNDFALILLNMGHAHKLLEADHDVEEDGMEPILEDEGGASYTIDAHVYGYA